MGETELLAQQFEANRNHLRAVAYRMLGSRSEAEDAVQEAWLRLSRTDANAVTNLTGWLTTVVARVCLNLLRTRKIRREEPIGTEAETLASHDDAERDAALADSIGAAMLAVLDPAVVVRADAAAVAASAARASEGAPALAPEIHGRERVAKLFRGQARAAQPAMDDGNPGLVIAPGGKPFAVFEFVIANDAIMEIVLTADTQTIRTLALEY
jgi:RNA polymerase sigma-70 factor (ECF subfamily)